MRRMMTAGAVLGAMALSAQAANVDFSGTFHITKVAATPGCIENGAQVGDLFFFRFRPPNLGTNGPATKLSMFLIGGTFGAAHSATLASGSLVGTAFKNVTTTGIFAGGGSSPATLRFTSQIPATLTNTTPTISIVGDWTNLAGDACTIGFAATVLKKQ